MKIAIPCFKHLSLWMLLTAFLLSCSKESNDSLTSSEIPISLSAKIQNYTATRVTGSSFDEGDGIGVFATEQLNGLDEARYVDNMHFVYSLENGFEPEFPIFFPENNVLSDFYVYYPYSSKGIEAGEKSIEVGVKKNQESKEEYSLSDFMVAIAQDVSASETPVDLSFSHRFFKLNIRIKSSEELSVEDLSEADPKVTIKDLYTKAVYDFGTEKFVQQYDINDIVPYGEWEVNGDMLVGKTVLLVPQTLKASVPLLELEVNGYSYIASFAAERVFALGKQGHIDLTVLPASGTVKCDLETSIEDWPESEPGNVNVGEVSTTLTISSLDFTQSSVYKVMSAGQQVAEISKEYLLGTGVACQALVAYPMKDSEVDLTNGLVLELLGETGNVHRGKVIWNADNTLTYTAGNSAPITTVYITADGDFSTFRPENSKQLQAKPNLLIDTRGTETITYPIVKIGTQYWMRGNLKTTKYSNGSSIDKGEDFSVEGAKYVANGVYVFYNSGAVDSGLLAADGWRVAKSSDWTNLKTYLNNKASLLKSTSGWTPIGTNLTGFNAVPVGIYNPTYLNAGKRVCYWATDDDSGNTTAAILLDFDSNEIGVSSHSTTQGYSVRCIRE